MKKAWPAVSLGELLTPVSRAENVDPEVTYRLLGAHWYAEGLYTKDIKSGSQIRASKVYRVEKGDFVYNRLFGWKGSFAVATEENHNCYVSNEFPCFIIDGDRLDGRYLWRYFSRALVWDEALGHSSGGTPTSRNRLKEEKLLAMQISLPPLSEQRSIVARIEELAAKVEQAQGLRREADLQCESLCRSIVFSDSIGSPRLTPMSELVRLKKPDVIVRNDKSYPFAGVYSFGRGVFKGQRKSGMEFVYTRLTQLQKGNFVYPKLMAWEGALGVVPPECDGLFVSPEFPVFEINESRVLPETLDVYFRTPSVWPVVAGISTGTNVRRRRLQPSAFLTFEIPLPSMSTQQLLRKVRTNIDSLKNLQKDTSDELDALLPSVLYKAFRGEL